jgi:hypothetical protein
LQLDPKFLGSNPAEVMDFKGDTNPGHTFLQRKSKATGPMSFKILQYIKNPFEV